MVCYTTGACISTLIKTMKLNLINKAYLVLAFILLIGTGYSFYKHKSWERYFYYSSVSAPATYPVYVRNAYFITNDRDDDTWFNTTGVNDFTTLWGDEYFFPEVYRPMRLPLKLVLQYVSYRDKLFYSDTLDLPQQKIKDIFDAAVKNKNADNLYNGAGDKKGLRFVLGIANDGNIILWLRGKALEKVVFQTKLTAGEPQGDATYYVRRLSKEAYIQEVFGRLPDSMKTVLDQGLEAHANYIDSATHYLDKKER